ncbi:hypothetical protein FNV43_RR07649 [Rhamnella rubrinervis]|uniref:DUF4408 domain-containing protein n=1 Tax=Rhamnella rubrinervis TaxID=2594499 RepID=A0A8K0HG58_9ROSA|nr:hypothetical protein FNV43_RR07649 [Rhamnella rubrinervis]
MAWMVSLQILLISSGVVFIALAMKVSVPLVLEFIVYHLPHIWSSFLSWLSPPFLYFIINVIIITIAASSRFNHNRSDTMPSPPKVVSEDLSYDQQAKFGVLKQPEVVYELREEEPTEYEQSEEVTVAEVKTLVVDNGTEEAEAEDEDEDEDEEEYVISRSSWTPPIRSDSSEILLLAQKPLVSARLGHRKPVKSSPEGVRALRVTKPKRHETLENTWKMITEGRSVPLSRHMKKCDTWGNNGRHVDVGQLEPFPVKKSETFKERTNRPPPATGSPPKSRKLRKEPSLSQEDLNRRVEAFINKFNEEMRLQRQESLNRYKEMINSGSH